MEFELLRVAIALIGTSAAAYQDYKTSYIDDKILYAMMVGGIILNLISFDVNFWIYLILGMGIIGIFGYFAYKYGQLGAGDVMLLAALQLLLPLPPLEVTQLINAHSLVNNEFYLVAAQSLPFIFNLFTTAAVLALVGSSTMYAYKLAEKKIAWKPDKLILAIIGGIGIFLVIWLSAFHFISTTQFIALFIIIGATAFSASMKGQIMKEIIIKRIKLNEIEDEDVIATEKMSAKLVARYEIERVATKQNLQRLKQAQQQTATKLFPVYKDLPRFAPYILAALVLAILIVNPTAFVLFN